ncbi:paraquat-inducible protein A [Piscinibacter sakaiensis]|uniref:paraquat-inducible protein A n=1 Tax=Piscinibacter sakaiensis TaxID=1547922 RepID=UPI003AAC0FA9
MSPAPATADPAAEDGPRDAVTPPSLLVCTECAQPHRWVDLAPSRLARCSRCDAVVARGHRLDAQALLALTVAALIVFLIANSANLITISLRGADVSTTVPMAIAAAWRDDARLVAVLAAITAVIAPAAFIALRLLVLVPLVVQRRVPPWMGLTMRLLHASGRWNTVSVLAIGALLSLVRIADLAQASAGAGLVALGGLAILLAAIESAGLRHLWAEQEPPRPIEVSAGSRRWLGCECCGWVGTVADETGPPVSCPRCGHPIEHSRQLGLQRTWALLFAALVLFIPANLMPMMSTTQALRETPHTLIGGIVELWHAGAIGLAVLVFVASIVVPLVKIGALAVLAWSVNHASQWRRVERARLYRLIEAVGHWSMLDVYVVVLLVGMVRFGNLASASSGPGLLAFAAVVVLTMLATHDFDPRWIWQSRPSRRRSTGNRSPGMSA